MSFSWLWRPSRTAAPRRRSFSRFCNLEALEDRCVPATLLSGFSESTFASGLAQPTSMQFAPDGRLFVTEKTGTLRVVQNGQLLATPFLTVSVNTFSERGLESVVFDPNFASNRFLYVYYTTNASTPFNRLSRFTADPANPDVAQAGSELVLLDNIPSTNGNHNGGFLHFGTDGMLYLGVGESGVRANAQDLSTLAGKVLRLNVSDPAHLIPADNPFVNTSGARPEIWAYGFRNPFTGNVDPATGRIFVNDVGENTFEEVDELFKGGNYGWPTAEGFSSNPAFVNPVTVYNHNGASAAITGGAFSRGTIFPASFQGGYFFSDYLQKIIRYLPAGASQAVDFATNADSPVDLEVGPDGRLYYLSIATGTVSRIDAQPTNLPAVARIVAAPAATAGGTVNVFDASTSGLIASFTPYPGYKGALSVATADFNGDGVADVITATQAGVAPHVKVFDGRTLAELASFFAYAPGYLGGVQLAAGDVTGDGVPDIVTGTNLGVGPHVKVFDGKTFAEVRSFLAFDPGYLGGIRVAVGDVNHDGFGDLIVAAGVGGNGHVRVLSGNGLAELASFLAYPGATLPDGVWVGAGDVDGDGRAEVLTGTSFGAPAHVKAFSIPSLTLKASFIAYAGFAGGVRVASVDANGDGRDEIVTAPEFGPPHVKTFDGPSAAQLLSFFAFDPALAAGLYVAGG
jgi:glucose/arabinose dehydrogenase